MHLQLTGLMDSSPMRGLELSVWLRAVLVSHTAYLMTVSEPVCVCLFVFACVCLLVYVWYCQMCWVVKITLCSLFGTSAKTKLTLCSLLGSSDQLFNIPQLN